MRNENLSSESLEAFFGSFLVGFQGIHSQIAPVFICFKFVDKRKKLYFSVDNFILCPIFLFSGFPEQDAVFQISKIRFRKLSSFSCFPKN